MTKHGQKSNWEKSVILLASLSQALSTCQESRLYNIFVDLMLKTLAPYFRIIGVWLTQGRFEDYRSEFVYGVKESLVNCNTTSEDYDSGDYLPASHLMAPSEKFWTHGFIVRPFEQCLKVCNFTSALCSRNFQNVKLRLEFVEM